MYKDNEKKKNDNKLDGNNVKRLLFQNDKLNKPSDDNNVK